jgi:putative pyoverdin transport system ATP-binding/permease protein
MILATCAGALSGVANVAFIALLTAALRDGPSRRPYWQFFVLCAGMLTARFAADRTLIRLAQRTVLTLRVTLCRQIAAVPLRQLETLGEPPLLAALTDDVANLAGAGAAIPALAASVAVSTGALAYCLWLSPMVFAIVIATVVLGVIAYGVIARAGNDLFRNARECQDALMRHYRTLINGRKEIKLNASRRARLLGALRASAEAVRQYTTAAMSRYALASACSQTLYFAVIACLVVVVPLWHGPQQDGAILTGTVLALLMMRGSVETLVAFTPGFTRAQVSLNKIERLGLSLPIEGRRTAGGADSAPPTARVPLSSIELRQVTHTFQREDGTEFTLGPIDLTVRAGEILFVCGGNGSGKTTLAKLFTGLYVPDAGEIRVNGVVVSETNRELYRSLFSAVFSDFHLEEVLPGTLDGEAGKGGREFLRQLQIDRVVRVENDTLSTLELSQGQRKRVALLAAYVEQRPIWVLDEWAADQDSAFRRLFYHRILPDLKAQGKTLFVITHDDQYFGVADRIVRLEEGKVRDGFALPVGQPLHAAGIERPWDA